MPKFPLIGPSYTSQSVNADCQTTMNLYPEVIESGAGNNQIVLYPAPGTKSFVDLTPFVPPPPTPPVFYSDLTMFQNDGGSFIGNTKIGTFQPGGPPVVEAGDTIILAFFHFLNNGATPALVTSVTMNLAGNNFGTWVQVGPTVNYGAGATRGALIVFTCKALFGLLSSDVLDYTLVFDSTPASNTDFQGNWAGFHHVGDLDQISSQAFLAQSSFAAPALTVAQDSFVLSYIRPNFNSGSVDTTLPFFKFTGGVVGCGLFNQGPALDLISPPGTYTPTWLSNSGNQDAGVINFSYKLP